MPQKLILSFPVHPEKRDEFVAMLIGVLPDTRTYDGCLGATAWVPEHDDGVVWIYEHWESKTHQAAYFKWRIDTGLVDAIGPFMTGPPQEMWIQEPEA